MKSTSNDHKVLSNNAMEGNFDSFMHSLSDHGENLLTEETVNKITEILTPEQRLLLEEEAIGSLMKSKSNSDGLVSREALQPCFQLSEHAQSDHTPELRPVHGGECADGGTSDLAILPPQNEQMMQNEDAKLMPEAPEKNNTIQEGLQKIKQQLGGGGKVLTAEACRGPAVVTEFIGDQGGLGFGVDLDDISKFGMDSLDSNTEKSKETDPPVRRSGRKTVRLFEIVPPKRGRKKEVENDNLKSEAQSQR